MHLPGSEGRKTHQITGAFAPDGEYLPFLAALVPDGGPELWLNEVEAAMFAAVKRHLFKVTHASATRTSQRPSPSLLCICRQSDLRFVEVGACPDQLHALL